MQALQIQQSNLIEILFDFKCALCPTNPDLQSFRAIVNHYKQKHSKTRTWTCCEKEISTCIDLIDHVIDHKGKWTCKLCDLKEFTSAVELWRHKYSAKHVETPKIDLQNPIEWLKLKFTCDLCGERFRTRGIIERHMKDAHTKNFTCDLCGEGFYNRQASARHRLEKHSGAHKVACPICGVYVRNTGHALRYHIKNLHQSKSMICPICGKICANDSRYRMHMTRNHQPPKYKCQYCEKRFK